jgi:hypothetical protein
MALQWRYNGVTMVLQRCYNVLLCACRSGARHGQELPLEVVVLESNGCGATMLLQ